MNNDSFRKRQTSHRGTLIACATALGLALTAAPARAQGAPPVPANIEVPAPNESFLLGRGIGTQNYVCQPGRSIGQVEWSLFTPQATLFSSDGTQLTTHFFGPNPVENRLVRAAWQDSGDNENRLGTGDRFLRGSQLRRARRDSMAPRAGGGSAGGTHGRHDAPQDHFHPALEHRWRRGAPHRLRRAQRHRPQGIHPV